MLRAAVSEIDGVADLHDLHVWSLSSGVRAMSAHVVLDGRPGLEQAEAIGTLVKEILDRQFSISHATLEFHTTDGWDRCVSDVERHVGD